MPTFKKIGLVITAFAITTTVVFAAWTDTKSPGDAILSSDWNAMVQASWDTASGDVYRATGDVGIGTTDPNRKLHIADSSGVGYLQLTSSTSGSTATDGLELNVGTDASVWNYETGYLRLGTANSEALRISSAGNVGIGTTSPESKLHVNGGWGLFERNGHKLEINGDWGSTGDKAGVYTNTGIPLAIGVNGSEKMRILTNGNVGIGTTAPSQPLDIESSSTTYTGLEITNTDTTERRWAILANSNGTTYGPSKGFAIRDVTGTATRFVIDTSGNVGIGTTSPAAALHIEGGFILGDYSSKPTCNSSVLGMMVFDTVNDKPYVCNSSAWQPLDSDFDSDGITDAIDTDDTNANDANALAADALAGKTFYAGGMARTGSIGDCTATSNAGNCYVDAATFSTLDIDLTAANILSGTNIFGVDGSASLNLDNIRCIHVDAYSNGYTAGQYWCYLNTNCTSSTVYINSRNRWIHTDTNGYFYCTGDGWQQGQCYCEVVS